VDAALILARLAAFGAGVALFGAPLFVLYGRLADHIAPRRLRLLLIAAAVISLPATAAALVLQTGQMAGDPASGLDPATLRDVITTSAFGASVLARTGVALFSLGLLVGLKPCRLLWTSVAGLGGVGLAALAWAGHGAADEGLAGLTHATADVVHLLSAGVWLGALLVMLLQFSDSTVEIRALHRALTQFSGVGSIIVSVILATGLLNCWFLVGPSHIAGLVASAWGRLLLVKVSLFAVMLGFAAVNRFRLTPRLAAAQAGDPRAALSALRRSVALESAAGLAVLCLVAALGVLAPPATG
jgi:putative copper resistance protein D